MPQRPMTPPAHRWRTLVPLVCCALLAMACAHAPIRGQVLDAHTGQPIPGAIALGVWTKRVGWGESHTVLVGVQETEVDAQGRFTLDRPSPRYEEERITVYKFGYIAWSNRSVWPFERRRDFKVPSVIGLEQFPANGDHREHLMFIGSARGSSLNYAAPKFEKELEREWRLWR
jgi:hypothetical protein